MPAEVIALRHADRDAVLARLEEQMAEFCVRRERLFDVLQRTSRRVERLEQQIGEILVTSGPRKRQAEAQADLLRRLRRATLAWGDVLREFGQLNAEQRPVRKQWEALTGRRWRP